MHLIHRYIMYSIEHLVDRAYESVVVSKKAIKLPNPATEYLHTRSYWKNMRDFIEPLNTSEQRLIRFFNDSLQSQVSVNGQGHMVISGRCDGKKIMSMLKRYIKDHLMCRQCKSIDTYTITIGRVTKTKCKNCNALGGIIKY